MYTVVDLVSDSDGCDLRGGIKLCVTHGGTGRKGSVIRCKGEDMGSLKGLVSFLEVF